MRVPISLSTRAPSHSRTNAEEFASQACIVLRLELGTSIPNAGHTRGAPLSACRNSVSNCWKIRFTAGLNVTAMGVSVGADAPHHAPKRVGFLRGDAPVLKERVTDRT